MSNSLLECHVDICSASALIEKKNNIAVWFNLFTSLIGQPAVWDSSGHCNIIIEEVHYVLTHTTSAMLLKLQ